MKFSCTCGKLSGELDNAQALKGLRFVCMCKDCQKFARFLGNEKTILDKNAGTEVVAVPPKLLRITNGREFLKGIRLTAKTGTFRWYADCCKSPIANSLSSKAGYIGFMTQRLGPEDRESFGPIRVRANGESGIPPLPEGTSMRFPLKWLFVTIHQIARVTINGWKRPNPFFDDQDKPLVNVDVL